MKELGVAGEASQRLPWLTMTRVKSRGALAHSLGPWVEQERLSHTWSPLQDLFFPVWTTCCLYKASFTKHPWTQNNQGANPSQRKANGRHAPLPMFFPGLILTSRKALSKVLHDQITRIGQAAFEGYTEPNRFPFKNCKTPKVCVSPTCSEGHFPRLLARFRITIQWWEPC